MARAWVAGVAGIGAMAWIAAGQEPGGAAGGPPEITSQVVALEFRYADGSRLTYEGRDAVAVSGYLQGCQAMDFVHGGRPERQLAGVRWTRTDGDGKTTRGAWPGTLDGGLLLDWRAPQAAPLAEPALERCLPGFRFTPIDVAGPPRQPTEPAAIERGMIVWWPPVAAETPEGGPRPRYLAGPDDACAFLREHGARAGSAGAAVDLARALAALARFALDGEPVVEDRAGGSRITIVVRSQPSPGQAERLVLATDPAGGLVLESREDLASDRR